LNLDTSTPSAKHARAASSFVHRDDDRRVLVNGASTSGNEHGQPKNMRKTGWESTLTRFVSLT
jgi:hypothetical protein